MLRDRDVNLSIFITFMSGSKSLMSFSYRFFHFRRPPGLGLAFDAAKRNERFGRIQCHIDGEQHQRKENESIPLEKNSESLSHSNELCEN